MGLNASSFKLAPMDAPMLELPEAAWMIPLSMAVTKGESASEETRAHATSPARSIGRDRPSRGLTARGAGFGAALVGSLNGSMFFQGWPPREACFL